MEKFKNMLFNYDNRKDTLFLYELALSRGKGRGWYPKEWDTTDYMNHLFKMKPGNIR